MQVFEEMSKEHEPRKEFLVHEQILEHGILKINLQNFGINQTLIIQNVHVRIHPLLGWTEIDIWEYIKV